MIKNSTSKYILGLNITGPNTSACLIDEKEIVAFVEEERFTRVKLATDKFPVNSIKYVLGFAGIGLEQVVEIAVGWDYSKYPKHMKKFYDENMNHPDKDSYSEIVQEINLLQKSPVYINQVIRVLMWRAGFGANIPPIKFQPHHKSHAASAAYLISNEETVNLVIDGSGEEYGSSVWLKSGNELKILENFFLPNSLGYFYAAMTEFLGFSVFTGEGKVMGMAPYGQPNIKYREKLKDFVQCTDDKYKVNAEYVYFGNKNTSLRYTEKLEKLLGRPPRVPESKIQQDDFDLAYETQFLLESIVKKQFEIQYKKHQIPNFTISGGVAMNCKMNGEISRLPYCDNLFVPPTSNDAGVALGSALLSAKDKGFNPTEIGKTFTPYLGPSYSNEYIKNILEEAKISRYHVFEDEDEMSRTVANYIYEGKIVGWFQGRMEVGSRALGNRSILANPALEFMKDKINKEVKRRESFRPFAPAILGEAAHEWFDFDNQANPRITHRWMLQAAYVKKGVEKIIPSVTHVDLSVRPQLVEYQDNEKFWKLIKNFEKISKIPIILNTSLNVRGEPIIRTPEEALRCFYSHGLDILVMNNYLLNKND